MARTKGNGSDIPDLKIPEFGWNDLVVDNFLD